MLRYLHTTAHQLTQTHAATVTCDNLCLTAAHPWPTTWPGLPPYEAHLLTGKAQQPPPKPGSGRPT
eukprot:14967887-Ditylum_brightwellii.AAC.1